MSAMERLLDFAERTRLIETEDRAYARNCLLEAMRLDAPEENANAEAPLIGARAAILLEAETGRVLFEKNADERLAIASTTKIMTALLAIESCAMDEIVTAGKNASGVPGTSIYLSEGEQLTMEEMLYGLMLRSGNDAAVAIAEHVAGSAEAFAERMNARAGSLGANAYFTTPNGLDSGGNGASARGIATIAREAMRHEAFVAIVSTKRRTIPWTDHEYMRVLTNKNKLLRTYDGALGIKTGFTKKAGRCLVFAAERDGMRVLTEGKERFTLLSALRVPVREGETADTEIESNEGGERVWAVVNGERVVCAPLLREKETRKPGFMEVFRTLWMRWSAFNI